MKSLQNVGGGGGGGGVYNKIQSHVISMHIFISHELRTRIAAKEGSDCWGGEGAKSVTVTKLNSFAFMFAVKYSNFDMNFDI